MARMQIGVNLAKSVFEVAVLASPGRVQERRRLSRAALTAFFAARPPVEVLSEAARNEKISRVPVKSVEQQAVVALHRLRQGYSPDTLVSRLLKKSVSRAKGSP